MDCVRLSMCTEKLCDEVMALLQICFGEKYLNLMENTKSGIKPGDYDEEGGHDEDDNEEEDAEDLSHLGLGWRNGAQKSGLPDSLNCPFYNSIRVASH